MTFWGPNEVTSLGVDLGRLPDVAESSGIPKRSETTLHEPKTHIALLLFLYSSTPSSSREGQREEEQSHCEELLLVVQ